MIKIITLFAIGLVFLMLLLGSYIHLLSVGVVPDSEGIMFSGHYYLATILALSLVLLVLFSRHEQNRIFAMTITVGIIVIFCLQFITASRIIGWDVVSMSQAVMLHLLLGMIIFWLLFLLYLSINPMVIPLKERSLSSYPVLFAMLVLVVQIELGAWVSTNHAGLACSGFPLCNGQWMPDADYQTALNLFNGGFVSYETQVAMMWIHRVGSLVCFFVLSSVLFLACSKKQSKPVRLAGMVLGCLLFVEIAVGIIGSSLNMPWWLIIAHNALAAVLMLPLIAIWFYSAYDFLESEELLEDIFDEEQQTKSEELVTVNAEEIYTESEPQSLQIRLKSQLKRTRSGLKSVFAGLTFVKKDISVDMLEEIASTLLMADMGIDVTNRILEHLTIKLKKHQLADVETLLAALKWELLHILEPCCKPLNIPKKDTPFVILVVGVNGSGKTTTIGKLAKRLQARGHSVMLAAGDTFRAAAVEQLQVWGERNGIPVVAQSTGSDSAAVIFDAIQSATAKGIDVLIADTAGRLQTKSHLMDELKKIKRIMGKLDITAPHEVLLVLDASIGQNALSQAKLFNEAVSLSGLVLTKLDGTAKGGIIFALAKAANIPIRFIGIGEGIDDLQDFDADAFVDALFISD